MIYLIYNYCSMYTFSSLSNLDFKYEGDICINFSCLLAKLNAKIGYMFDINLLLGKT